jgi:hypothetical protein
MLCAAVRFGNANMDQGSGAVASLIGDVNGDGKAEVIQFSGDNNGTLGMLVWGFDASGKPSNIFGTKNLQNQGSAAVAWLIGDQNVAWPIGTAISL